MSESWGDTLYPIVKKHLENNLGDGDATDDEISTITNLICQEIDEKYLIINKDLVVRFLRDIPDTSIFSEADRRIVLKSNRDKGETKVNN